MTEAPSDRPLRVLVVAETYPPDMNGAAIAGERLAHGMRDRGHDVRVVAPRPESGPSRTITDSTGMVIHQLRSRSVPTHDSFRIGLSPEIRKPMRQIFDDFQPDIVHVQCHYTIGATAIQEASQRGIRLIATNHFMPDNLLPFLPFPSPVLKVIASSSWRSMNRKLHKADVVTTPTPRSVDEMARHGITCPIEAISNGIDIQKYELREGEVIESPGHPTALFVGRLAQEKHVDELIRAVALLPRDLNVNIEVVGDGEQRPMLESLAHSLGIAERVRFLGRVSDEDLRSAYLRCTFFCMPGTADLQSLATLEALSSSKPVLLANALALPHLVQDGVNGYLFEPGDVAQLSDRIRTIVTLSPKKYRAMCEASHAIAETHSFQKSLDTFEARYRG